MDIKGLGQPDDSPITKTAAWLASICTILTKDPIYSRSFNDPYAIAFASAMSDEAPALLAQYDDDAVRRAYIAELDAQHPGLGTSMVYRRPWVEKNARAGLAAGATQLVIIGAGCDSLAMRLAADGLTPAVFEIDRPEVIAFRDEICAGIDMDLAHVRRVGVDFDLESFEGPLLAQGYDTGARTVFVAEGVIEYLDHAEVEALFRFAAKEAASKSRFVFTFTDQRVSTNSENAGFVQSLIDQGEPFRFDLTPEAFDDFLSERGLRRVELMTPQDIEREIAPTVGAPIGVVAYMYLGVGESC